MHLEDDKRLNLQLRLDFSSAPTGEAWQAGREDIESSSAVSEPERPPLADRFVLEVALGAAQRTLRPLLTSALRSDCLPELLVAEATPGRSPGVSSVAFRAQLPDLRLASDRKRLRPSPVVTRPSRAVRRVDQL